MPFDPNKPYDIVGPTAKTPSGFDPSKPYTEVAIPSKEQDFSLGNVLKAVGVQATAAPRQGYEYIKNILGDTLGTTAETPEQAQARVAREQQLTGAPQALQEQIVPYLGATALTKGVPVAGSLLSQEVGSVAGAETAKALTPEGVSPTTASAIEFTGSLVGGIGAGTIFEPKITKEVLTSFGKKIESLPAGDKANIKKILDRMDELGIERIDDEARLKIVNDITDDMVTTGRKVDDAYLSMRINDTLNQQKNAAYRAKNEAYDMADSIAETTGKVDFTTKAQALNADRILAKDSLTTEQNIAYKDLVKKVNSLGNANAMNIEKKLQEIRSMKRSAKYDTSSHIFDDVIASLESTQRELLGGIGMSNVYDAPRNMHRQIKIRYEGEGTGEGIRAGKKVASVIDAQDSYNVTKQILSPATEPNVAKRLAEDFDPKTRKDMVLNLLTEGIENLNTADSAMEMYKRFGKMDKKGLREMLGKAKADQLNQNMNALALTESVLKDIDIKDREIGADVVNFLGAAAASNISPYASMHVAINSAKNIVNKKKWMQNKQELIKRVNKIEKRETRNALLKALALSSGNIEDQRTEEE